MGLELSAYDIDVAHRLGKYEEHKIRAVIVKFVSRQTKFNFMKHTKTLKGTKYSVNEDLTSLNRKMLSSMRLKENPTTKVMKAWSFEGKPYFKNKEEKTENVKFSDYQ